MSIEFERGDSSELGRMEISCDYPGCNAIDCLEGDFKECIAEAKELGWRVLKIDFDEWLHYCPDHANMEKET